eukprot:6460000-Alexandrium_andersonii.AAC.1
MRAIRVWLQSSRVENMGVERQLALIRKSVDAKMPSLDRLLPSGYLAQLRSAHVQAGGRDAGLITRAALQSMPTRANKRKR